ncbi:MAG: hypothetical protein GTO41_09855 [Burkholderiales bacterium]|nr:hypothetical protein [Burkholderiales bacterium]
MNIKETRVRVIDSGQQRPRSDGDIVAGLLLGLFLGIFGALLTGVLSQSKTRRRSKSTVAVRVTQCEFCSREGKIRPHDVDFRRRAMTFLVNDMFKRQFHTINGSN